MSCAEGRGTPETRVKIPPQNNKNIDDGKIIFDVERGKKSMTAM